jgi:hypothetical protein
MRCVGAPHPATFSRRAGNDQGRRGEAWAHFLTASSGESFPYPTGSGRTTVAKKQLTLRLRRPLAGACVTPLFHWRFVLRRH